jgi:hypothetical protein
MQVFVFNLPLDGGHISFTSELHGRELYQQRLAGNILKLDEPCISDAGFVQFQFSSRPTARSSGMSSPRGERSVYLGPRATSAPP